MTDLVGASASMSGAGMFLVFVAVLLVAARLCLRGEHRPPIPPEDPAAGFRDPSRLSRGPDRRQD